MANPQEEEDPHISGNLNPIQAWKRQVIEIDTTTQITENTTQSKTNKYTINEDTEKNYATSGGALGITEGCNDRNPEKLTTTP
eukprot:12077000-Ditylum_brightwellii.AAC.1